MRWRARRLRAVSSQVVDSIDRLGLTVEGSLAEVNETLVRGLKLHHFACVALNGLIDRREKPLALVGGSQGQPMTSLLPDVSPEPNLSWPITTVKDVERSHVSADPQTQRGGRCVTIQS